MRYKILGKTGLEVSELGFGTIQITRMEEKDAIELIRFAHDEGITLIDTANTYFNSEEIVGKALKGIRDDMVLISKSVSRSKKHFLKDINTSLKRMQTDYIDIYFVHFVSKEHQVDEVIDNGLIEALLEEKKKGHIGHMGFSCHSSKIVKRLVEMEHCDAIMVPLNFISTEYVNPGLIDLYKKQNTGLLAMKAFGGGRLIDIELCFKFLRSYPDFIPLPGMQSLKELRQNIELVGRDDIFTQEDNKKKDLILEELGDKFCRQCGYCMPCEEKGIEIIDVNFIEVYYKQFPEEEFWNRGFDKIIDKARECIECNKCSEKCPYNLDVPEIIKKNIKFYDRIIKNRK